MNYGIGLRQVMHWDLSSIICASNSTRGAQQLSQLYASQIVFDVAPGVATACSAAPRAAARSPSWQRARGWDGGPRGTPAAQLQPALERPPGDLGALQLLWPRARSAALKVSSLLCTTNLPSRRSAAATAA